LKVSVFKERTSLAGGAGNGEGRRVSRGGLHVLGNPAVRSRYVSTLALAIVMNTLQTVALEDDSLEMEHHRLEACRLSRWVRADSSERSMKSGESYLRKRGCQVEPGRFQT
jgi:hypothetical protein